jgi:L-ribulose-5-phosphate 3-epimerase
MSISRREFSTLAAGAIASTALASRTSAQPSSQAASSSATPAGGAPKRTLRKAVMLGMIGVGSTWEDKLKAAKDAGFDGIEADSPAPQIDELIAASAKIGLPIHGMVNSAHWSLPLNAPGDEAGKKAGEALETCLRDAKKAGASSILLVPGVVSDRLPYDECWTLSIERINRAVPLAKDLGVTIAIENVWNQFLLSPLEAARYLDEINDPIVQWHFDIGNVINFGWPEHWIKILGPRIAKLHIKDFSRKKRNDEGLWKGFSVELGEGDAGWERVMKALDDCGYSTDPKGRWATAEVAGGDFKRLTTISEQMDRLFAK